VLRGCVQKRLTDLQVRFIRDAYKVHMKERRAAGFERPLRGAVSRLAAMFGVHPHHIHKVAKRKMWKHIR
jgi:hypothetical protein